MIWLWRIFFSATLAMSLSGATVSGTVKLRDSRDPAAAKKMDYSAVVIWLEPVQMSARPPTSPRHSRMVQKDKTFTPHVLAIPAGSTVEFPNFDPIFHNAFSNYDGKIFDLGLYPPGSSRAVRFGRPGIVRVFCNIHANMSAIIAVLNTPWFAVTGKDGRFTIADVPAGEYSLRVFHERATAATLDSLTERLSVSDAPADAGTIAISESGYLAIPHRNKYGRDYPPPPDTGSVYPAVRQ
jgi:plastocyanin